jgi:AcrR family transcriptional regulator
LFRSILADFGYAVQMQNPSTTGLSGRRGQARRNDVRILEAAREVFVADPAAPVSAVAARANVGISALYRRYPSKEDLLRQLARDGLLRYIAEAEAALADDGNPWDAFAAFMYRILDAEVHAITINLAGTFAPTPDLIEASARAADLNRELVERTKRSSGLRADVEVDDLSLILEQVSAVRLGGERRTRALRHRYLALFLAGLKVTEPPLPGPAPRPDELAARWIPKRR